jgi:hypothetical protein
VLTLDQAYSAPVFQPKDVDPLTAISSEPEKSRRKKSAPVPEVIPMSQFACLGRLGGLLKHNIGARLEVGFADLTSAIGVGGYSVIAMAALWRADRPLSSHSASYDRRSSLRRHFCTRRLIYDDP